MRGLAPVFIALAVAVASLTGYFIYKAKLLNSQPVPRGLSVQWSSNNRNYIGTPGIDTEAFYENVRRREAVGACRLFSTVYSEKSNDLVINMAESGDLEAMTELAIRWGDPDCIINVTEEYVREFLERAASRKHVDANLIKIFLDSPSNKSAVNTLERVYEPLTPAAVYIKMLIIKQNGGIYSHEDIKKLIASGNPFLMAAGSVAELEKDGRTDLDAFCEAYFRGCGVLYEYKLKHNILCGR